MDYNKFIWELSVVSAQFFYKPQAAIKNEGHKNLKIRLSKANFLGKQ
jgi:hypothetical protein